MENVIIPFIVLLIVLFVWELLTKFKSIIKSLIILGIAIVLFPIIFFIDIEAQTMDTEVWSGSIVDWKHKEEWDEWHPPVENCTTDSKGNTKCTTTPGYWEHHYAENYIKTSDNGWIYVDKLPNGKEMDDSYPNSREELMKYWKKGTPTASTHIYQNKVQASYSVFKHENIDLADYKDLPEYPDKVRDELYIDRIVGVVPNKQESILELSKWNTELNKFIEDPENPGEKKSWKQVNLIFVNVGENKPEEYGFALQDKWEGGNKNDFVVSFSMNKDGKINWVYPFSWSEVEILKLEVKDYMMSLDKVTDFKPIVEHVSVQVAEKFERKEFAEFSYLHVELSLFSKILIWVLSCILVLIRGIKQNKYGGLSLGF